VSVDHPVEGTLVNTVMGMLVLPLTVAPLALLVVRYWRGDEQVKRQVLWLLFAMVCILLINSQRWVTGDGPILPRPAAPRTPYWPPLTSAIA